MLVPRRASQPHHSTSRARTSLAGRTGEGQTVPSPRFSSQSDQTQRGSWRPICHRHPLRGLGRKVRIGLLVDAMTERLQHRLRPGPRPMAPRSPLQLTQPQQRPEAGRSEKLRLQLSSTNIRVSSGSALCRGLLHPRGPSTRLLPPHWASPLTVQQPDGLPRGSLSSPPHRHKLQRPLRLRLTRLCSTFLPCLHLNIRD